MAQQLEFCLFLVSAQTAAASGNFDYNDRAILITVFFILLTLVLFCHWRYKQSQSDDLPMFQPDERARLLFSISGSTESLPPENDAQVATMQ